MWVITAGSVIMAISLLLVTGDQSEHEGSRNDMDLIRSSRYEHVFIFFCNAKNEQQIVKQ